VPWQVPAAIGSIETDHGRSRAPGVRSGVNSHACCAGAMQFNLRDGPPSTWDRYAVDGDRGVYDPADAIAPAASYLSALLRVADGNLARAVLGYNHTQAYVNDVLARVYADLGEGDLGSRSVRARSPAAATGSALRSVRPAWEGGTLRPRPMS
jgi:Transglycosylase SLT domain